MFLYYWFLRPTLSFAGLLTSVVRPGISVVLLACLLSSCAPRGRDGVDVGKLCTKNAGGAVPFWLGSPQLANVNGRIDRTGFFGTGVALSRSPDDSFQGFGPAMKDAKAKFSAHLQRIVGKAVDETVRESGIQALSKIYFSSAVKRNIATNALRALVLSKMVRSRFFYDCATSAMYVRVGSYVDDLRPDLIESLKKQSRRMGLQLSSWEIRRLSNLLFVNLVDASIRDTMGASDSLVS